MQDQIGDKRPHQVFPLPGVQQRHVQHADIHLFFLGQHPPLLLNICIVAPQPVNAQHIEQVARLQLFHHPLILRPLKILAGLLVHKNIFVRHALAVQRHQLPILVLIHAGHADITIYAHTSSFCRGKNSSRCPFPTV